MNSRRPVAMDAMEMEQTNRPALLPRPVPTGLAWMNNPLPPARSYRRLAGLALLGGLALTSLTACIGGAGGARELGYSPPSDQERLRRPPPEQVQPLDPTLVATARQ